MNKTFFKTSEELKEVVSGMDISFDRVNLSTGTKRAAGYLKDLVTKEIYTLALDHYHSDDYMKTEDPDELKDNLVGHVQFVMGNLTMYFHFIWLQLRIANDTMSVTDKDNIPYKYQSDEAQNQLFETASEGINDLVDFLNENKGQFQPWEESEQFTAQKNLLFKDYKDFDKYFGIDRSAAFYIKARGILQEVLHESIEPRTGKVEKVLEADPEDKRMVEKIKRAAAYLVIGEACLRLDYFFLPSTIRGQIDNEYRKKEPIRQTTVRERLSALYREKGNGYLRDIDLYRAQKNAVAGDSPYKKFESVPDKGDKHVTML